MTPDFQPPLALRSRAFGDPALQRALFRCDDCLVTFYISGSEEVRNWIHCPVCSVDETDFSIARFEGWLNDGRIKRVTSQLYCDASCNTARGLDCECKCSGEFHGLGFVATFQQNRDEGSAPKELPVDAALHRQQRAEYRAAVKRVRDSIRPLVERRNNREWLPRNEFMRIVDTDKLLSKARHYKTHNKRMETLNNA